MLPYTTTGIEKELDRIKNIVKSGQTDIETEIKKYEELHGESVDYLRKYCEYLIAYSSRASICLAINEDINKFKGYCFLAARAGNICFKLFDYGFRTKSWAQTFVRNLETREDIFFYVQYAILANHKELAMQMALEDSLLGSMLIGDYEKAKLYLLQEIKEVQYTSYVNEILWTIVYKEEKRMNQYFEKRVKLMRKEAKIGVPKYLDLFGLALIKLAKVRDMTCKLQVRELPQHLLDDTPVNEDDWLLPEDPELERILLVGV